MLWYSWASGRFFSSCDASERNVACVDCRAWCVARLPPPTLSRIGSPPSPSMTYNYNRRLQYGIVARAKVRNPFGDASQINVGCVDSGAG